MALSPFLLWDRIKLNSDYASSNASGFKFSFSALIAW